MYIIKQELRRSLLVKMLAELLETRIMVKNGVERDKDDKTLQQLLNNRQLALKFSCSCYLWIYWGDHVWENAVRRNCR